MFHSIAKLTMAQTQAASSDIVRKADAMAPSEESTPIPIFINPKALTFPVLVALLKAAWAAIAYLPVPHDSSKWFPFVACMVLGLLVAISNLLEQKVNLFGWVFGLIIGSVNSLVIFGAVVAIPSGKS